MSHYGHLSSAGTMSINSLKWKIPNFLQSVLKVGEYLYSPQFSVWDSNNKSGDCRLMIYPKGEVDNDFLELYFCNQSSIALTLSFSIFLEDKDGNKSQFKFDLESYKFGCNPDNIGAPKLIKLDKLKESSSIYLPGGTLTIILNIYKPGPKSGVSSLSEDYQLSFLDEEFSDVKIKVKGETFSCHRYVLASRSPVLKAMVRQGFKEDITGEINLDSMEPQIVKEMLMFIYTGKIQNLDANAVDLMKASDIYQLDNLKDICSHHLSKNLNLENCLDYLVLGDRYRETHLKDAAKDFIVKNIKCLMKTEQWDGIGRENATLIVEVMKSVVDNFVK